MTINIKPENRGKLKEENGVLFKLCSKCKLYKELNNSNFALSKINKSGYKSSCKICNSVTCNNPDYYYNKNYNNEGLLLCKKCNIYKKENCFYKSNITNKHRNNFSRICKNCDSIRKANNIRTSAIKSDIDLHIKSILRGCKSRVKGLTKKGNYRNLKYDLDIKFIKELLILQNYKCAISGIDLTFNIGNGKQIYNLSIDRIDCNEGYIKNNVQLVCSHINIMRGNLDVSKLIELCNKITEYNENKN